MENRPGPKVAADSYARLYCSLPRFYCIATKYLLCFAFSCALFKYHLCSLWEKEENNNKDLVPRKILLQLFYAWTSFDQIIFGKFYAWICFDQIIFGKFYAWICFDQIIFGKYGRGANSHQALVWEVFSPINNCW